MYANCEQVLLKELWGEPLLQNVDQLCKFCTEFDFDTLRIWLSILAESYHSFRQGEGSDTLLDFLKKNKKRSDLSYQVKFFSGHASNK